MESLLTAVADYLMRQSVQIAAVFLLVAMVCWGLRKTSAHWRYLLWLVVLAKCLAPGLISVPLAVLPRTTEPQPTWAVAMHSPNMLGSPVAMPSPVAAAAESEMALVSPEPVATRERTTRSATMAQSDVHVASTIWMAELNWRAWLAAVWCSGVATCLTCVSIRAWTTRRRLKRMRRVADREIRATVAALAERLGLKMVPTVYMVDRISQPFVWGWLRGSIYLPEPFVGTGTREQQQAILTHELAHVARWDAAANLVQIIAQAAFFFHPLIWWTNRQIRREREKCCDEIVIAGLGADPKQYGQAIVNALVAEYEASQPVPSLAVAGRMKNIEERIQTILNPNRRFYRRPTWAAVTTVLLLAAFAIPTALVPVRAQERPAAPVALPASEPGSAPVAADAGGKQEETAKKALEKTPGVDEIPGLDPKIKELGEEVKKRMNAWSDEQTLTLKEGETGRMKIKKNVTPVAEILITPHFVEKETKLGLEGVDAAGKKIAGTSTTSLGAPDGQLRSDNLGGTFHVDGENVMSMIQWKATRQGDDSVVVEAKALFMRIPTAEELEAMLLASMGKRGRVKADFMKIDRWIWEYRNVASHDPKSLAELDKTLPKDFYSPTGEDYHYEVQRSRYILSSCGPDGIYGNDDDDIEINDHLRHSVQSGTRRSLYPLPEEKDAGADTETKPGQGTVASAKAPNQNGGRFHLVRSNHTWIGTDGTPIVYDEYDKNFYMFWGEHTVVLPRHTEGFFDFYKQRTLFPEGCPRMDVSRDHPASDPLVNVVMPGAIDLPAYQLLLQPSVQRALNLSDEQRTKLRDISANYWPERRKIAGKELADTESVKQTELAEYAAKAHHGVVQSGHLGDGSPFSKEVVEKLERQWSGARKQIEDVLTPEQLRTLKDLTFRTFAFGSGAMFEPEVLVRLGVAKIQQDELRTLELQLQKEKERRLVGVTREKIKKMLAVLTPQQQAQLREKHSPDENPDTDCSMYPYPGLPSHMPDTGLAEELGFSAQQRERVRKIVSAHWTTLGALQQEEQNLPLGDEKAFKAIGEKRRQEMADLRKQIEAALTPEQWASCKEMAFENLAMPSLRMAALTEQQRAALREIEAEYVDKPEQIYCEMTDKALTAFTPAQQERLRTEVDRRGW